MKRESSSSSCPVHRIKWFYQNSFPLQLESSQQAMFAVFTNPETEESWKKLGQEMTKYPAKSSLDF